MADEIVTVKPCIKCGATERYSDGHCKMCARAGASTWGKANPEKKAAIYAEWQKANKEKENRRKAAWKKANPEKAKASQRAADLKIHNANPSKRAARRAAYRKTHPEKDKQRHAYLKEHPEITAKYQATYQKTHLELFRIKNHDRRAKMIAVGGRLSKDIVARLLKLQRGKCACCGLALGDNYHLDHRMPLALGGKNIDDNMQLLRATCNVHKGAKHPIDFMQKRGFLL